MSDVTMSYVGHCTKCGAVCCAVVDDPKRKAETAEALHEWILDDLEIEHVTHEYVRENFSMCTCAEQSELQPALPGLEG